jgi:hypothetical protein
VRSHETAKRSFGLPLAFIEKSEREEDEADDTLDDFPNRQFQLHARSRLDLDRDLRVGADLQRQ